jgi:predicted nuclease of predicted toxin-antitoxin system
MAKILADENVHHDIIRGLREQGHEVLFVPEIGLAGSSDDAILQYSIKHNFLLLSGDKDFGGLIEFGTLWGKGQVILLRYRLINIKRMVKNIGEILANEQELIASENSFVIVLSEAGYRIHRHRN